MGLEAQNDAAEIKLRAERRLGDLVAVQPKQDGGDAARAQSQAAAEVPTRLDELGISKSQSSRCQTIAAVPEPVSEEYCDEALAFADVRQLPNGQASTSSSHRVTACDKRTISASAGRVTIECRKVVASHCRTHVHSVPPVRTRDPRAGVHRPTTARVERPANILQPGGAPGQNVNRRYRGRAFRICSASAWSPRLPASRIPMP